MITDREQLIAMYNAGKISVCEILVHEATNSDFTKFIYCTERVYSTRYPIVLGRIKDTIEHFKWSAECERRGSGPALCSPEELHTFLGTKEVSA